MPAEELTIGEVAARSGVAQSALRFYESAGLIASRRTTGNQRRYERATLRRVAFIQAGKAAGIPLVQIAAPLATLPVDRINSLMAKSMEKTRVIITKRILMTQGSHALSSSVNP